jgi:hypothetical protein
MVGKITKNAIDNGYDPYIKSRQPPTLIHELLMSIESLDKNIAILQGPLKPNEHGKAEGRSIQSKSV